MAFTFETVHNDKKIVLHQDHAGNYRLFIEKKSEVKRIFSDKFKTYIPNFANEPTYLSMSRAKNWAESNDRNFVCKNGGQKNCINFPAWEGEIKIKSAKDIYSLAE